MLVSALTLTQFLVPITRILIVRSTDTVVSFIPITRGTCHGWRSKIHRYHIKHLTHIPGSAHLIVVSITASSVKGSESSGGGGGGGAGGRGFTSSAKGRGKQGNGPTNYQATVMPAMLRWKGNRLSQTFFNGSSSSCDPETVINGPRPQAHAW
jgi:hypothetical protein